MFSAPICWARVKPAIRASYSLSLLVAPKLHLTAREAVFPVGEVRTIPTPAPLTLLDPSTCRIHTPSVFALPRRRSSRSRSRSIPGENSAVSGQKITSYSPNSTAHLARRPEISGLWSANFIGKEVTTTIG
ncbi:hypothetical protein Bca4012_020384 [Brassica carinata]